MLLLYFISLLSARSMKLKVDAIVNPVLFEEEDTGLVELAIDLEDEVVYIFNPRQQRWNTHFVWNAVEAIGLAAIGRATVQALDLNRSSMWAIRAEEELRGRHPPPEDINPVDPDL
ncbi:hypothetical protein Q5692_33470 [Microcoleus sp. C2C3]|uniref:hypothetical protein n=1 Tax=unclassified Microcoleus TaxID=2642155 RepID=UPI002FD2A790